MTACDFTLFFLFMCVKYMFTIIIYNVNMVVMGCYNVSIDINIMFLFTPLFYTPICFS